MKQQGLTHAGWLESARQLDQPRTLWNRVKQKTRACASGTQRPLRCSSPASSEAQPDHCRKDVQKVGSQRHSQWHPVSKHRKSSPVHAGSAQEELRRKEQHMEERKMEKKKEWCFQETTQTLFKEKRKGGPKKETKLSSSTMVTVDHESEGAGCGQEPIRMRKKNGTQPARSPVDFVRRPKEAFLMGPWFSSRNLDKAGHFGPFHGSNGRRSGKQMITLDLNHFGFCGRGRSEEEKMRRRREQRWSERRMFSLQGLPQWWWAGWRKHLGHS